MSDPVLGRPLWHELLTTDMKAAGTFYSAVIGWDVKPFDGSGQPYDMFHRADGVAVAGVMHIPEGMNFPPHWEMYIGVPRLEDAVATIERLGGSSLSHVIEVPTVGRLRTMKDPQGAIFAIHEPLSPPSQPESEPEVGDIGWRELYAIDPTAAMKFYTELFGWKQIDAVDIGPLGTYYTFGRAFEIGGMMARPPEMTQGPPHWGLYFRVPDIHAGAERVKANGGQVLHGPVEVPGGDWIVQGVDPQGAAFSLSQKRKW
jgi:predicted enzyme related to lactoylglutathione lyase